MAGHSARNAGAVVIVAIAAVGLCRMNAGGAEDAGGGRPVLPTTRSPCVRQTSTRAVSSASIADEIEPSDWPCLITPASMASLLFSVDVTRAAISGA